MYIGSSGVTNTEVSMYFGPSKLGAFQTQGLAINRTSASFGVSGGQLVINGGASTTLGQGNALSYINFYTSVSAAPTDGNARSNGTRIVLQPNINVNGTDAAIGYNDTDKETWITGARTPSVSDGRISFYAGGNTAGTSFRRVGYFSGTGLVFDSAGNATNAPITFNATTINWINFGTIGNGAPSAGNSRSNGTRICLYPNVSVNQTDYAIGVNTTLNETWICGGTTTAVDGSIGFYAGTAATFKRTVWVSGNALNLAASTVIVGTASQDVFNTVSTTVNFAGAATTLAIGNTATAAQTVNMFTASTGASIYNFATGATISGSTKAINIGTAGASGSFTNINLGSINGGNVVTIAATVSFTSPQLLISNAGGISWMSFGTSTINGAVPTVTTQRSEGTKIVLMPTFTNTSHLDAAIGVSGSSAGGFQNFNTWISSPGYIDFYGFSDVSGTPSVRISNTGLTLTRGFSDTTSQLTFNGGLGNGWALMGSTSGSNWSAPSTSTRVDGTRIVLYPSIGSFYDSGIGITGTTSGGFQAVRTYISSPGNFEFYIGSTPTPVIITASGITLAGGSNIVLSATTGTQIGTSTTQLLGFHGTGATAQRAAAAQAAVATTAATLSIPYGYTTAAQADGIVTLLNEIRTVLVNKGLMKGSA